MSYSVAEVTRSIQVSRHSVSDVASPVSNKVEPDNLQHHSDAVMFGISEGINLIDLTSQCISAEGISPLSGKESVNKTLARINLCSLRKNSQII